MKLINAICEGIHEYLYLIWYYGICVVVIFLVVIIGFSLMSCFLPARKICKSDSLRVKRLSDGKRQILSGFHVKIIDKCCVEEEVPIGANFKTDYSSLPFGLRWTMDWSRVDVAGVVHDWLYATNKAHNMKRLQTDRIWRDIARSGDHRAYRWQAAAGWLALRIFGWITWNKYKKTPPSDNLPANWCEIWKALERKKKA